MADLQNGEKLITDLYNKLRNYRDLIDDVFYNPTEKEKSTFNKIVNIMDDMKEWFYLEF